MWICYYGGHFNIGKNSLLDNDGHPRHKKFKKEFYFCTILHEIFATFGGVK